MISKQTLQFLTDLKRHNNRDWFNEHKERYLSAAAEFEAFIDLLIKKIGTFDKGIAGLHAKDCIFRIYRDVRFAKDKSPYKTHFGAWIVRGGKKSESGAGYYVHVEPDNCFLAGGAHMPPTEWLEAIRKEIYNNGKAFKKIIASARFKKYFKELEGEQLQRPPRGFDANHPDIAFIKKKSFLGTHKVPARIVVTNKFMQYSVNVFKALSPLNKFLNSSVE